MNGPRGLRLNICKLETSYDKNRDILDLDARIESNVPHQLIYASRFWSDHLYDAPEIDPQLEKLIEKFLHNNLLHWLELLSLCNDISSATRSLAILGSKLPVRARVHNSS